MMHFRIHNLDYVERRHAKIGDTLIIFKDDKVVPMRVYDISGGTLRYEFEREQGEAVPGFEKDLKAALVEANRSTVRRALNSYKFRDTIEKIAEGRMEFAECRVHLGKRVFPSKTRK